MTLVLDGAPVAAEVETQQPGLPSRLPLGLLGLWLTTLVLVPDRFTLPKGANVAVRPHHAVLGVLLVVLVREAARGRTVHFGPASVVLVLPLAAGVSLLHNLGDLDAARTAAGLRAFGEVATLAAIVLLTAAVAPDRRQRRQLIGGVVALLLVGSGFGYWEASTGQRALDGLPDLVPLLGVETFSATGAKATADPFAPPRSSFQRRAGRNRVAGTTRHAIEFSVVMAFGVALAAALAASTSSLGGRALGGAAALTMAAALPLALARSGVLALVVAAAVVVLVARRRIRTALVLAAVALLLGAVVNVLQPAATDALVGVVAESRSDSSVEARTADYGEIDRAVGTSPWLGLGVGQWESYRTPFGRQLLFDNQYLLTAEETGLIGLLALVVVFAAAVTVAGRWCRRAVSERPLAVGVLAALVAFVVVSATFDSLYFSQVASLFMLLFGLACVAVTEDAVVS
jgi:hypothetical protein